MTPAELKKLREAAGLTRTDLASRIGVTERTVIRWENGQRKLLGAYDKAVRWALDARVTVETKR